MQVSLRLTFKVVNDLFIAAADFYLTKSIFENEYAVDTESISKNILLLLNY